MTRIRANILKHPNRRRLFNEVRDYLILISLGILMTWSKLTCKDCGDTLSDKIVIASYTSLLWVLLWKGNDYLAEFISARISWLDYPIKRFWIGAASTIAYTFLAMYLLTVAYEGTFAVSIPSGVLISVLITIAISLFMHGRVFLINWRKAAIEVEKMQQESMAAKYQTLKSQVNPHFLFNSLNALANLIYEDEEKALRFIDQLALVYDYVLQTRDREIVHLSEELRFLDSYLFLQEIRFGDKLRINNNLALVESYVAPLALQMLIENAIKHNVVSQDDPLTITLREENGFIVVINNLQKKTSIGDESSGVGLENIRRRYDFLSKEKVIVIEDQDFFKVMLPILRIEQKTARLS